MNKEDLVNKEDLMSKEDLMGIAVKPKAFVLMPFAPEFDAIFETLIVGALKEAGFEVFRADNIKSQRNIMRDVIDSIVNSDLVIADLTSANPNVFYELGVAHGLQRPVVLLTQEIRELPFDLKPYRVISYGTHFSDMNLAKKELTALAMEVEKGNVRFGNPVSDFLGGESKHQTTKRQELKAEATVTEQEKDVVAEELGFLDHLVGMEDSFGELTELMGRITDEMRTMSQETSDATKKIKSAQVKRKPGTARYQRKIFRELGGKVEAFGQFISESNGKYRASQLKAQRSLEAVIVARGLSSEENRSSLRRFLDALNETEGNATSGRDAFANMAETMRNLDNIEVTFSRANLEAAKEIDRLAENIDLTIALINRARKQGEELLKPIGDEDPLGDGGSEDADVDGATV